jgi:peptidoglycan-associated lipoprotein
MRVMVSRNDFAKWVWRSRQLAESTNEEGKVEMKKLIAVAMAVCAALMFGCSSDPIVEDGKPGVEDRKPQAVPPELQQRTPAQPQVIQPGDASRGTQLDPLKDPNNVLSKRSIFYEYDSDAIKEEYRPMLQAHAKYLSSNRTAKMLIQGNTDERGSREYNLALGQRRADAVRRTLVLLGAPEAQIESVSLGEEKPRAVGTNEADFAQNRRSDLLYGGEF